MFCRLRRASCKFMPPCGITETLSDVESVRVVHKSANNRAFYCAEKAVKAAEEIIDNRCYKNLGDLGQIEIVLDDDRIYKGKINKWVAVYGLNTLESIESKVKTCSPKFPLSASFEEIILESSLSGTDKIL